MSAPRLPVAMPEQELSPIAEHLLGSANVCPASIVSLGPFVVLGHAASSRPVTGKDWAWVGHGTGGPGILGNCVGLGVGFKSQAQATNHVTMTHDRWPMDHKSDITVFPQVSQSYCSS